MKLSNTLSRTGQIGLLIVANIFCLAAPVLAADVEVSAGGGVNSFTGGGGSHGLFGGTAGIRLGRMTVFGEGSWSRLGSFSYATASSGATISENLTTFGGGVDYALSESKRIVPYVVAAAGVGRFSVSATESDSGVTSSVAASSNAAYFGAGGGARVFLGKKWGLKPEFRYQRYNASGGGSNSFVASVGMFWRFGE